jgi:hypothetical protein
MTLSLSLSVAVYSSSAFIAFAIGHASFAAGSCVLLALPLLAALAAGGGGIQRVR